MIKKYIVQLTNKAEIPIDEDEVDKVVGGIQTGKVVRVRQGIFNPSFFVAMIRDAKREQRYFDDNQYRGLNQAKEERELKPLPDIFSGILEDRKQLTNAMRIPPTKELPEGIER